jgi:hypothetical protein
LSTSLYETDFYAWTQHQAKLLKEKQLAQVDLGNIAEELESMGKSEKRELESRLVVLIMQLLKWQFQPKRRNRSWRSTTNTQRDELERLIRLSPSLKNILYESITNAYSSVRYRFEDETSIKKEILPDTCQYTFEQIMDKDFWPNQAII